MITYFIQQLRQCKDSEALLLVHCDDLAQMVANDKQHRAIARKGQKQVRQGRVLFVERNLFMS